MAIWKEKMRKLLAFCFLLVVFSLGLIQLGEGIPLFGRQYGLECQSCHLQPPKLNLHGEAFAVSGKSKAVPIAAHSAIPLSVWASGRFQDNNVRNYSKGTFNRVEIISGGFIGSTSLRYFVEWLPVSNQVESNGTIRKRSGRFEDLLITIPIKSDFSATVGQFRPLAQVDVSRRLSVSEPLAFASGIPGTKAGNSRINSLRSFSPSGRAPTARINFSRVSADDGVSGLYANLALTFPGEIVIPLMDSLSRMSNGFALEGIPKGGFFEAYYKNNLSSIGFHGFAGNGRDMIQAVGVAEYQRVTSTLALGVARERIDGVRLRRYSWDVEWTPVPYIGVGSRWDDKAGPGNRQALFNYLNLEWPLTTFAIRLTLERRWQTGNNETFLEWGIIF